MTIDKRSSGKAEIECRYNPVQHRWRVQIVAGRKRVGPLFVRVAGDTNEADAVDEAARVALGRAVDRHLVDAHDIEAEDGVPVVHTVGWKRTKARRVGVKAPTRRATVTAKARSPRATVKVKGRRLKAKAKAKAVKRSAPVTPKFPATKGKPASQRAPEPHRSAPPMGRRRAKAIVGNGKETRALEDLYEEAKSEYHAMGEALKERHLAVASVAAQPE